MGDFLRTRAGGTWRKSGFVVIVACVAAALAGCGGGDDDTAAAQNPPPNNPPPPGALAISGSPSPQAMQGQQYSFTPTVTAPAGATLTFSIAAGGTPSWATFNTSTGRLSGTPAAQHVGQTTSNIRISVTDGTTTANLAAFSVAVVGTATGSAMLSWTPPTTNTDGTPLGTSLTGYRIYWGTSPGSYSNSTTIGANVTSHVVSQLTPATWYFAATALTTTGESAYSNEATKVVQ